MNVRYYIISELGYEIKSVICENLMSKYFRALSAGAEQLANSSKVSCRCTAKTKMNDEYN